MVYDHFTYRIFYKIKYSLEEDIRIFKAEKYLRFLTCNEYLAFRILCLIKSLNPFQLPPWPCICVLHLPVSCFSKIQSTQNTDLCFNNICYKYSLIHILEYRSYSNTAIARKGLSPITNPFQTVHFPIQNTSKFGLRVVCDFFQYHLF